MRSFLTVLVVAAIFPPLNAAEKKLPIEETSNELIDLSANALIDKDQIQQALGADPGPDIVVVRVTVRPVSDKPVQLSLDDFYLFSTKDGQRSEPYAPSQIAGSATLVVTPLGHNATEVRKGPTWGGMIGGIGGGAGAGNSSAAPPTDSKVEVKRDEKPNPLLQALQDKVLPEKEIKDSTSGLLYFQITGKVKPKDLELHYKGPAGRLALRFHP